MCRTATHRPAHACCSSSVSGVVSDATKACMEAATPAGTAAAASAVPSCTPGANADIHAVGGPGLSGPSTAGVRVLSASDI